MCARMNGPSTRMPQRPITTLGTAASISINEPIGPRIDGGASSDKKRPIAIESGAARYRAPNEVIERAEMNGSSAPNSLSDGFHPMSR